jgi:hypothetical protein
MLFHWLRVGIAVLLFTLGSVASASSQMLETETARLLRARVLEMSGGFEFQDSSEGTEAAVPFAFEYGIRDNLEFLLEPVAYTAIRPNMGQHATGPGDMEATLTYRFRRETGPIPALAAALEVKVPTANNSLIGTGEEDYTGYLIASKQLGGIDTHYNLSYTHVGKSEGVHLNDIVGFAVAGVYRASARVQLFGEVLGNTASTPEADTGGESAAVPEAAGGELVGTLGAAWYVGQTAKLYLGLSYDNNSAVLFHPGLTIRLR